MAEEALRLLRRSCFDAEAADAVKVLLKIVDNIIADPSNPKRRRLRLRNKVIRERIANRTGAKEFLAAIGFTSVPDRPSTDPTIEVLERDLNVFVRARKYLVSTANDLKLKVRKDPPISNASTEDDEILLRKAFESRVVRMVPQPRGDAGGSDDVLRNLKRREDRIVKEKMRKSTVGPGQRGVRVLRCGEHDSGDADSSSSLAAAGPLGFSQTRGDGRLLRTLAKRRHENLEKKKNFTTRSMRELEAQRRKRVYVETLVRVQLPCKSLVEALFRTDETVGALVEEVRSWLVPVARTFSFTLFTSLPKVVVSADTKATVGSLRLGPAVRLYMAWVDRVQPPTSSRPHWLNDALVASTSTAVVENDFPSSEPLDPRAIEKPTERGSVTSGARRAGDNRTRRKKPAWLKL